MTPRAVWLESKCYVTLIACMYMSWWEFKAFDCLPLTLD